MKKILLSLFVLGAATASSYAQDSLTAANLNPILGESFISFTCDTLGVTQGAAGASVTWDFTGLMMTSTDTGVAVMCAATPNCGLFPGSTIAIKSLTGPTVTYAIANTFKYSQNGYYNSSTQYATFTDPLDQLHYPMRYLDSFTDSYAGTITYTGAIPITAHESGVAKVKLDGYGTLMLPGGITETNVYRTHSYQLYIDSASVFGIDTVASFVLNTYTWYTPGYHSPLLTILTSDQVGGTLHTKVVSYAKRYTLGVNDVNDAANTLNIYPNPATSTVNIGFTAANNAHSRITLTDLLGREVAVIADGAQQGKVNVSYNTGTLPRGMYIVRLQTGNEVVTRKLDIQ